MLLWASSETILRNVLHGVSDTPIEQSGDLHLHKHNHLHLRPKAPVSGGLTPVTEQSGDSSIEQRRDEVSALIAQGATVSEIARQLGVSRGTVYGDKAAIEQAAPQGC